ncbi:hypothetical protein E4U17_003212, partial [Claviceps sp. LM77 group G4]
SPRLQQRLESLGHSAENQGHPCPLIAVGLAVIGYARCSMTEKIQLQIVDGRPCQHKGGLGTAYEFIRKKTSETQAPSDRSATDPRDTPTGSLLRNLGWQANNIESHLRHQTSSGV